MASIKQKANRKFKLIVCNGYRPNGSKISKAKTITVPNNIPVKRIPQYVAHAAEEFEREFRYGYSEDADTPFEAFAEKWLGRQVRYRASTLAGYRSMLKAVYPAIGGVKICDIKPITLENLAATLRERIWRGHRIGEGTVQKYLETVSAVLQDAVRNDILPYNPAHRLRLPRVEPRQQLIPTKEELLRLLDSITREPVVFRVYFTLAILTGMRRGELAALRWGDIGEHHIRVARSRSQVTGVGIVEGKTKNGKTRFVPLHQAVHQMLTDDLITYYIDYHLEQSIHERPIWPSDYIFVDRNRRPYHPDTFSKRFRKLLDANGFDRRYHLHTMRHFLASFLLSDGISNKVVADLLGHRDTAFLEKTYGHPLAEYGADAANCVAGLLQSGADGRAFMLIKYETEPGYKDEHEWFDA